MQADDDDDDNDDDKFWTSQDVLYNWEADFTGTGNQSLCLLQCFLKFC